MSKHNENNIEISDLREQNNNSDKYINLATTGTLLITNNMNIKLEEIWYQFFREYEGRFASIKIEDVKKVVMRPVKDLIKREFSYFISGNFIISKLADLNKKELIVIHGEEVNPKNCCPFLNNTKVAHYYLKKHIPEKYGLETNCEGQKMFLFFDEVIHSQDYIELNGDIN